jgi:hypothetical protein
MPRLRPLLSFLLLALLVSLPSAAVQATHPSRSKLAPCKVPGGVSGDKDKQVDALCGIYPVWENREAKAGRKIRLQVVVLPAPSATPLPDPVVPLSGGPGAGSTGAAGFYAGSPSWRCPGPVMRMTSRA